MACGAAGPSPQERDAVAAARAEGRGPGCSDAVAGTTPSGLFFWESFKSIYFSLFFLPRRGLWGSSTAEPTALREGGNPKRDRNKPKDSFFKASLDLPPSKLPNDRTFRAQHYCEYSDKSSFSVCILVFLSARKGRDLCISTSISTPPGS